MCRSISPRSGAGFAPAIYSIIGAIGVAMTQMVSHKVLVRRAGSQARPLCLCALAMTVQYADSDYLDDDVANTLEAAEDSAEPGAPEVLPINEFLPDASPTAPRQPREYEEDPQIRTADAEALKREADEYFRRKQYVAARSTYEDAQRVLSHEDVTDDAGDAARVLRAARREEPPGEHGRGDAQAPARARRRCRRSAGRERASSTSTPRPSRRATRRSRRRAGRATRGSTRGSARRARRARSCSAPPRSATTPPSAPSSPPSSSSSSSWAPRTTSSSRRSRSV